MGLKAHAVHHNSQNANSQTRISEYKQNPRPGAGGFVQIRAFSKINLILDVLGRRSDGYHDLRSVMQTLSLHDTLTISVEPSQQENFRLICSDPRLPTDDRNLVTRAAKYMMQEYNITWPICIQLKKRIPASAGLAGGSSDCAATLAGLNTLFDLNIPLHSSEQCESLMSIGRRFGADVPFCLMGGTALAEGVGEVLTPLPAHPHCWVVLACPKIPVSTAKIFSLFKSPATKDNSATMINALHQGNLHQIAAHFSNDLAKITTKLHPEIQELINEMKNQGAINASMSGSGPSVFGYFTCKDAAIKAQIILERITGRAFLTETINQPQLFGGA